MGVKNSLLIAGDMLVKLEETMKSDATDFGVRRKLNNFFCGATCVKIDNECAIAEKREDPSYEIDFNSREYNLFAQYFLNALKKLGIVNG